MREIVVDQSPYGVEALRMWPFCVPTSGVVFVHYFNAFFYFDLENKKNIKIWVHVNFHLGFVVTWI